ncbi:hypothetical protein KFK09_009558 [Dendrobium nobile]|uniref:Uncharacterized protein n=1 Tax=Dendrobium nobile TaxID=94219 RepID=A0A8T3BLS1_DENNO|nr:hypothetical protein KFK09_009558 [Dendrobium nobile]
MVKRLVVFGCLDGKGGSFYFEELFSYGFLKTLGYDVLLLVLVVDRRIGFSFSIKEKVMLQADFGMIATGYATMWKALSVKARDIAMIDLKLFGLFMEVWFLLEVLEQALVLWLLFGLLMLELVLLFRRLCLDRPRCLGLDGLVMDLDGIISQLDLWMLWL